VGLLAASVVHDFNNALTALRAHLHVAQLSGSVEPVTQCHAILDQCSGLTRWLLDFCSPLRAPRAVVQSTDLVQCVSEALGIVRRLLPKNVLIQVCHDTASAEVQVEPGLIEHALVNLILNARDAIAGGGTISVGVRSADSRHQLVVEDTGTGIAPDILGRVFEPFFSTKRTGQGTGLGLASVRRMVESAFGAVAIRSEPGRGTRVTLEFPRVPSEDASPRQRGGESHGMGRDDRSSMAPPAELR
jgi:two-component system cell cycle sensor histidine kinase/response regulator CckA